MMPMQVTLVSSPWVLSLRCSKTRRQGGSHCPLQRGRTAWAARHWPRAGLQARMPRSDPALPTTSWLRDPAPVPNPPRATVSSLARADSGDIRGLALGMRRVDECQSLKPAPARGVHRRVLSASVVAAPWLTIPVSERGHEGEAGSRLLPLQRRVLAWILLPR